MTTVLVTGAGGYIGQRLTLALATGDVEVRALTRRPMEWPDGIESVVGDLVAEPNLATSLARGVDVAIHLAGANEVAAAEDPAGALRDTVAAAESVAQAGLARVIYLSTVHVYGDALSTRSFVDEGTPAVPTFPYAEARLACEDVFTSRGCPTMIFRLTNAVGAPARPDVRRWSLVANELCREGALDGRLTLRTAGVQWRDFIALSDVVSTLTSLVDPTSFRPGLYNLASGASVTIRDLAALIQDSFVGFDQPRPELSAPPPPPDPPGPCRIDIHRLEGLGIIPSTSLRQAVDETVQFCLDHRAALR
jgi:UDP-glucose 4-epimerase